MRFVPDDLLLKCAAGKPPQKLFGFMKPSYEPPTPVRLTRKPTPKAKPSPQEHFPALSKVDEELGKKYHQHAYEGLQSGRMSRSKYEDVVTGREARGMKRIEYDGRPPKTGELLEKLAKSYELKKLIEAKDFSDNNNYPAKNKILCGLMNKYPKHFKVDSSLNAKYIGLTHNPTGFRIHAPRFLVPTAVEKKAFLLDVEEGDDIFDVISKKNLYHSL